MDPDLTRQLARFRIRVGRARFLGGLSTGLTISLITAATLLLALRLAGLQLNPAPSHLPIILLPAIAVGLIKWWRTPATGRLAAGHLDRHLEMEGLLLAATETDCSPWSRRLHQGLDHAGRAMPRLRAKRLLTPPLPAALFLLLVTLLPAPDTTPVKGNPLIREELHTLEETLAEMSREGVLPEEPLAELKERLQGLEERFASGQEVEWSDIDAVAARMAHEQDLAREQLAQVRTALEEASRAEVGREQVAKALAAGQEQVQALAAGLDRAVADLDTRIAAALARNQLPPTIPPELAAKLARNSGDLAKLTAKELAALDKAICGAEKMAGLSPELARKLAALARSGRLADVPANPGLTPEELRELAGRLARQMEGRMMHLARLRPAGKPGGG